ncbi:hypothetical protein [Hymenobacter canadensis]|uniref:Grasp-with-spasm system SPASM domain peptide maturase n=1 Tax=Hymenobacter canadensis TaxID=2999067 RepID=A0ABY7LW03_9BACT|nr:hypothetical protein [Hymenobacter canadensis]WBA44261.1 hypothetical protein O3303_21535 [Hymenobacter canadensis]
MENYLKLYAFCIPVRGKDRSLICDLQRCNMKFIPNSMLDLIEKISCSPIDDVVKCYGNNNRETVFSYIYFLLDNNLAFYTCEPSAFPELDLSYLSSQHISSAVIEYNGGGFDLYGLIDQLDDLICAYVELRVELTDIFSLPDLHNVLNRLDQTTTRSVILAIKYSDLISLGDLYSLTTTFKKLEAVVWYSCPDFIHSEQNSVRVMNKSINELESSDRNKYIVDVDYFTEALKYNPYYNKKVCINSEGEVKNCLHHKKSFGHVGVNPLEQIISSREFQKLWYASHDRIIGVMDLETRYNIIIMDDLIDLGDGTFEINKTGSSNKSIIAISHTNNLIYENDIH